MYLPFQPLLQRGPSIADLFVAALTSPQAVRELLPDGNTDDPLLLRLQQAQHGPIVIDLWEVDMHLSIDEVEKIVHAIRDHWHRHGFCIVRCRDPQRWAHMAYAFHQPLLHWRSLSLHTGWDLFGAQLRATELDVFRHLVDYGTVTVEQVARDPRIFSQHPKLSDWRVQLDIAMGRVPQGPVEFNRSEAQRILTQMHNRRIVLARGHFYSIVRPTRDNGVPV